MYKRLDNVVLMWAKLQEPVLKYGSTTDRQYELECIVNEQQKKEMEDLKVNKTFTEVEGGYSVKFTRPEFSAAGKAMSVNVIDAYGEDVECLIGNGSIGNVQIYLMEGSGPSKGKLNARLNGVQITDLITYESGPTEEAAFSIKEKAEVSLDDSSPFVQA